MGQTLRRAPQLVVERYSQWRRSEKVRTRSGSSARIFGMSDPYGDQGRAQKTPFVTPITSFVCGTSYTAVSGIWVRGEPLQMRRSYHCSVPDASTSREQEITGLTWSSVYPRICGQMPPPSKIRTDALPLAERRKGI